MQEGEMIEMLKHVEFALPELLKDEAGWNSLDVIYERPHVERVWRQSGDYRICLHRIYTPFPEEPLYHRHPWPSAVRIHGGYTMKVGYGVGDEPPPVAASIEFGPGSVYEMIDPNGWHSVHPGSVSLSLMVIGKPFGQRPKETKAAKQPELPPEVKSSIIYQFREIYDPEGVAREINVNRFPGGR